MRKGESSVDGADDRARKDERSEDGIAPQKKARHDFVTEARQRKGSEAKKQKTKRRKNSPRIFLRKGESSVDGADDRARTGTKSPSRDFKSLVSAIPPHRHFRQPPYDILTQSAIICNDLIKNKNICRKKC